MIASFFRLLNDNVPPCEKFLALLGASVASSITLSHVSSVIGIMVGIGTLAMLIPRIVIGWLEMRTTLQKRHEARERAEHAMDEARAEAEGCDPHEEPKPRRSKLLED
jgi:hypothetical protein